MLKNIRILTKIFQNDISDIITLMSKFKYDECIEY